MDDATPRKAPQKAELKQSVPSRKALETGFLILALMPQRTRTADSIKEAAKGISNVRTEILPSTRYQRCTGRGSRSDRWRNFWSAFALEAPGIHANQTSLVVPEYPLAEPQDVNYCDLERLSEAVWQGIRKEAESRAPA